MRAAASVALFIILVCLIPVYNKATFLGTAWQSGSKYNATGGEEDPRTLPKEAFRYPLFTTLLQLACSAAALTIASCLSRLCTFESGNRTTKSWVFGVRFLHKCRKIFLVGFLFGLKFATTNYGLYLLRSTTLHILFQASDVVFTLAFSRFILPAEVQGRGEYACVLFGIIGTILLAVPCDQNGKGAFSDVTKVQSFALVMNLVSPALLGLCVTMLRKSTKEMILVRQNSISALEFTAFKLWWSALTVAPFAIAFEWYGLVLAHKRPLEKVLFDVPASVFAEIIGGAALVCALQVNITWLSSLTSAATLGIIASFKVLPQSAAASFFDMQRKVPFFGCTAHNLGATLMLAVSCMWAVVKYRGASKEANKSEMEYFAVAARDTYGMVGYGQKEKRLRSHSFSSDDMLS